MASLSQPMREAFRCAASCQIVNERWIAAVPIPDPQRRHRERSLLVDEIPSPMRKLGDDPLVEPLVRVGEGHYVARHSVGVY